MAPDVLLTALNARYIHPSLGARSLLANMGDLRERTALVEFDINVPAAGIADRILACRPRIVGLGIYVWNVTLATEVLTLLKAARPDLVCVIGGPEVTHETEFQPIAATADFVIRGEGDTAFAGLCRQVLAGASPDRGVLTPPLPDLGTTRMPYDLYATEDLAHRLVYVETSRGCPYRCEYCLSALDAQVRAWPLDACLAAFDGLLARGARRFKFVDRTFNLSFERCTAVMDFFLDRYRPGLEVHFEMVPSRFPPDIRERLRRFPPGSLRLEIGVQTFNQEVARRIRRPQDNERIAETFRFLREETEALVHADLIAGLPGEDLQSFGEGFDRLLALEPREIQVGLLKRLRGVPITRHDESFAMVYDPAPPYPLLHNRDLNGAQVQQVARFARYWERLANRRRFPRALPLLWGTSTSPFRAFLSFSDWLFERIGRTHTVTLDEMAAHLWAYLTEVRGVGREVAARAIETDYTEGGRRRTLPFLQAHLPDRS